MKRALTAALGLCILALAGCSDYRNIPAGYAGKILTPTGYEKRLHTSGQVDIGRQDNNGLGNSLVLVENTSITVTESFNRDKGGEDHRIVLQDMVPMSVDVRINFLSPDFSKSESEKLFTLVTPEDQPGKRLGIIKLEVIYRDLARMGVRTAIRTILDQEVKDYKTALSRRTDLNNKIGAAVIKEVETSGVPLKVRGVDLSRMMPDEAMWRTNAQISSAEAQISSLKKLAEEIDKLPNGLEIYRLLMLKEVSEKNGATTVIWPLGAGVLPVSGTPKK